MISSIEELKSALAAGETIVVSINADLSGADLIRANLSGANLSHVNLSWANLGRANLSHADLSGANLGRADLSHANLSWANLGRANLSHVNLSGADLSYADLSGADLIRANLSESNLSESNLTGADLIRANLSGANLSGANLRLVVTGNSREIVTMQSSRYKIAYTSDTLAIGCKQYSIKKWQNFSDETIAAMDHGALDWWLMHKPLIMAWIAANPATPHGGHKNDH